MPCAFSTDTVAVQLEDSGSKAVPVRIYQAMAARPAPLVLHLHGGAFQAQPADAARPVAALLAEAGAVVVSADYPSGGAHPFPAAIDLLYALLHRLHADRTRWAARASKLFVAGEEAGGNLAAALAMIARDRLGPPVAGQILLSPMLDAGMATCSFRDAEAGPVGCKWADGWRGYLGGPEKAAHPYAAPGSSGRLAGLPPALLITAQDDPMRDEALRYAQRLRNAGVAVRTTALTGPSGWPDALAGPSHPEPGWAAEVRQSFTDFFATITPTLVPAPTNLRAPARSHP